MAKRTYSAADKAKFAEERAAKIEAAKTILSDGVRKLQTSDDWTSLLARIAKNARRRFRVSRYSFTNQLLVWGQSPEATATAGYKQWQAIGRQVKKGAKGIMIRQPKPFVREQENAAGEKETHAGIAFGVAHVFDISQTEGKEIAEVPSLCERLDAAAVFAFGLDKLRDVAMALEGAPVSAIAVRAREPGDPSSAAGWYRPSDRTIVVVDNGNHAEMFHVLAHEVAHAIMHGAGDRHDTATKEVEAESVAFIVAQAAGLDASGASFPYVASWAGKDDAAKKILESGERITRAASVIVDALYGDEESAEEETAEAA